MLGRQIKNRVYFAGGLAALALVSAKHRVNGYSTPTGFSSSDWDHSASHVISIVNDYSKHAEIDGRRFGFDRARVLELGPGLTLGTGVLLAGLGIKSYLAIDAFPLVKSTAPGFYELLAEAALPDAFDRVKVAAAARSVIEGDAGMISYAHDADFDVARLVADRTFDFIVSNAAFEHFDEAGEIIAALSRCAAPGALFMAMVDFQTHSRFVRTSDPNNIYRFSPGLYRALHFPGQPNRWRPKDYVRALAANGWTNIAVRSVETAPVEYCSWTREGLAAEFRADNCDMHILTGVVVAERPRG